jgi:hypothetical protein
VRVHDHDLDAEFVLGHPNGLLQIRVIRDDRGLVATPPESVEEQVRGQVTLEPFSSVLMTSTVRGPPGLGSASGIRVTWLR